MQSSVYTLYVELGIYSTTFFVIAKNIHLHRPLQYMKDVSVLL